MIHDNELFSIKIDAYAIVHVIISMLLIDGQDWINQDWLIIIINENFAPLYFPLSPSFSKSTDLTE